MSIQLLNFFSFSCLFNAITAIILVPIILFKKPRSISNVTFLLFLLVVIEWSLFYFLWLLATDVKLAEFLARTCMIGVVLMPPIFLHFITSLIESKTDRKLILINYLLSSFFILTVYTPLYLDGMKSIWGIPFWPIPGPIFSLTIFHFISVYLYTHFLMWRKIKINRGTSQNQILYVFIGTFIGGLAGATNFLSWYTSLPPVLNIFTSVYIVTITFAITKHELMDIRVVIGRGLAYGIVGVLLITSFISLNLLKLPLVVAIIVNSFLGLFWAFAAHRLRDFIQTPIEEKWITGWYDSDKLINTIAKKLVPILEREEVFRIIEEELKSTIKIKNIQIFSSREGIDPEIANLQDATHYKNGVVLPLFSSGGFEGTLIIDRKISEDPYTERDITLFRTIMNMVLAIFDRIKPYEQVKKEFETTQMKLIEAERQLERSARLASLGTVAAGVAHEIRNPLAIIRLKIENVSSLEDLKDCKKIVAENVQKISSIIRGMLGLSKSEEKREVDVDLNEIINSTLAFFTISGIKFIKNLSPVPTIKGNPEELKQVFINLIDNAIKAMPEGGDLRISVYQKDNSVYIEISDTGKGISKEDLEKIFDPFYSTRHEGTGLGLSIAYRIIREHGGSIKVESEVGKGTTFKIEFGI